MDTFMNPTQILSAPLNFNAFNLKKANEITPKILKASDFACTKCNFITSKISFKTHICMHVVGLGCKCNGKKVRSLFQNILLKYHNFEYLKFLFFS